MWGNIQSAVTFFNRTGRNISSENSGSSTVTCAFMFIEAHKLINTVIIIFFIFFRLTVLRRAK